jgi:hypothetical protein
MKKKEKRDGKYQRVEPLKTTWNRALLAFPPGISKNIPTFNVTTIFISFPPK